jgi:hypothetical protein
MRPGSRGGATRHQAACEPPGWLRRALSEVAALGRQTNVAIGSGERTAFVRSSCGSLLPLNPCARLDQYDSGLTRASGETPRLHSIWKQKSRVQRAAAYTRCSPLTLLALRRNNRGIPRATSTRNTAPGALQNAKDLEAQFQAQQARSAARPRSRGERIC